jgi:hypothetical protein
VCVCVCRVCRVCAVCVCVCAVCRVCVCACVPCVRVRVCARVSRQVRFVFNVRQLNLAAGVPPPPKLLGIF